MTDFLDHLIARTVDASTIVRPRPVSLFEPSVPPELPQSAAGQAEMAPPAEAGATAPVLSAAPIEGFTPPQIPPVIGKTAAGPDGEPAANADHSTARANADISVPAEGISAPTPRGQPVSPLPEASSIQTPPDRHLEDTRWKASPLLPRDGRERPIEEDVPTTSSLSAPDNAGRPVAARATAASDMPSDPISSLPAIV